ncbi:MAG: response regulator [Pelosinus sp.]|nr:response regulator [Pelosinus sp.]
MNPVISGKRPEILIIDDSTEQILFIDAILQEKKYLVRALTDAGKTFETLKKKMPDLILLDVVMPHQNGYSICRELKKSAQYRDIPVIFLTSMADSDSIVTGFLAGAQDYVAKPVNSRELLARVETHIYLKQQTDKLKEAYQEIEAFSHMVSHDLKAPLWAIQRLAKHTHAAEPEELGELIDMMCEKADEAVNLIDRLSEISRMFSAQFVEESIDMNLLVAEVLEFLAAETEDRIVEFHISNLPNVRGDKMLIRQVLVNIFGNALKFTRGRDKAVIEMSSTKMSSQYLFKVKDNGAGFNMKYGDRLFGIFQRLHSSDEFEGTGTGLLIIKKIITRHGGEVSISGEVENGAEISFTLPL